MIEIPVIEAKTVRAPEIQSDWTLSEAASSLRDPEVPALVVRDSPDELAGIVTESDVVAAVAEGAFTEPVATCMSRPVVTVSPTTPVGLAADRMRKAGLSLLPIVDGDDSYHGVVTRRTLAPYVSRQRLDVAWDAEPLRIDERSPDEA